MPTPTLAPAANVAFEEMGVVEVTPLQIACGHEVIYAETAGGASFLTDKHGPLVQISDAQSGGSMLMSRDMAERLAYAVLQVTAITEQPLDDAKIALMAQMGCMPFDVYRTGQANARVEARG